jgi:hypothetical protein
MTIPLKIAGSFVIVLLNSSSWFWSLSFFLRMYSPNPPNDDSPYSSPKISPMISHEMNSNHSHCDSVDALTPSWPHVQSGRTACGPFACPAVSRARRTSSREESEIPAATAIGGDRPTTRRREVYLKRRRLFEPRTAINQGQQERSAKKGMRMRIAPSKSLVITQD